MGNSGKSRSGGGPAITTTTSKSASALPIPPLVLLFLSLAILLFLSSSSPEESAAAATIKDVSVVNPSVHFVPSYAGGQYCERVRVSGIPRLNLGSYSSVRHVAMNVSSSVPERSHWKIEVCFHRNASLGFCQCELDEWQAFQKGQWNAVVSPYQNKYLDVKVNDRTSAFFTVSIREEFQKWRLVSLVIGFLLLLLAPIVSCWTPFYYSSSMALGILLVVLIILFQGVKLLPIGRKNFIYLTIYGSVLGIGSYVIHCFSSLVGSIVASFGLSDEMHNPVSVFMLVVIVLVGAGFGYWMVRKYVISRDGSVDAGVAQFVKWAMRVFALCCVIQSTRDALLALVALAACWSISTLMTTRRFRHPATLKQMPSKNILWQIKGDQVSPNSHQVQFLTPSAKNDSGRDVRMNSNGCTYLRSRGQISPPIVSPVENKDEHYFSTFHKTPQRKYSKKGWEDFTHDWTRKSLIQLASSAKFAEWFADNGHRIQLEQDESLDDSMDCSSNSSEDTDVDNGNEHALFRWP